MKKYLKIEYIIILAITVKLIIAVGLGLNLTGMARLLTTETALAAEETPPPQPAFTEEAPLPAPEDLTLTQKYRSMLLVLENREKQLNQREALLEEKEAALMALQNKIRNETSKLSDLINKREALLAQQRELVERQKELVELQAGAKDARINHLVQAYSAMRAENAGELFNSLEDDVAVRILAGMNARNAGKIMAFVEPTKAARLTKMLSELNREIALPEAAAQ